MIQGEDSFDMIVIGARFRGIRQQWRLSLLEVAQRSHWIARERGELSYQVTASWLARLESGKHELAVNQLIALAEIYSAPIDQLLGSIDPENQDTLTLAKLSSSNENLLLAEGPDDSDNIFAPRYTTS